MGGETINRIGDFGEDFFQSFFKYFGWEQLGDSNVDADCVVDKHKTAGGGEKKTHGIDAIYKYINPFDAELDEVILVEGKNISWGKNSGEGRVIKTDNEIIKDIQKYLRSIQEKIVCAQSSGLFKDMFGLTEKPFRVTGLLFLYIRDEFFDKEKLCDLYKDISISSDLLDTSIFIMSNNLLQMLGSMFHYLQLKSHDGELTIEYMTPRFDRKTYTSPWISHVPLTLLYSKFIVARIDNKNNAYIHYIFYFGEYSQNAMKRLISALVKFNIFHLPNLKICPIGASDPIKDSIAFRQYFANNTLKCNGISADIGVENPDTFIPSFNLVEN